MCAFVCGGSPCFFFMLAGTKRKKEKEDEVQPIFIRLAAADCMAPDAWRAEKKMMCFFLVISCDQICHHIYKTVMTSNIACRIYQINAWILKTNIGSGCTHLYIHHGNRKKMIYSIHQVLKNRVINRKWPKVMFCDMRWI